MTPLYPSSSLHSLKRGYATKKKKECNCVMREISRVACGFYSQEPRAEVYCLNLNFNDIEIDLLTLKFLSKISE